jgi:hypothetical protein
MKLITKMTLFALLLTCASPAIAAEPQEITLGKSDLERIKIFGNEHDRIHFFLTDTHKNKYRISNLKQKDAATILEHFKNDDQLLVQTEPNKRGYLDIVHWQKK